MTRWSSTGRHTGEFLSIPATGKRAKNTGISIVCIAGGKVVEDLGEASLLGLMQQLEATP